MALIKAPKKAYIFEINADQILASDFVIVQAVAGDGQTRVELSLPVIEAKKGEADSALNAKAGDELKKAAEINGELREKLENFIVQNRDLAAANNELKNQLSVAESQIEEQTAEIKKLRKK